MAVVFPSKRDASIEGPDKSRDRILYAVPPGRRTIFTMQEIMKRRSFFQVIGMAIAAVSFPVVAAKATERRRVVLDKIDLQNMRDLKSDSTKHARVTIYDDHKAHVAAHLRAYDALKQSGRF